MKVKAVVDFGGQYAMLKGETAELPDNPVTEGLINGGFIKKIEAPATAPAEKPTEDKIELDELTKADLLKLCEEKGIEADKKAKKEDLIKALEG